MASSVVVEMLNDVSGVVMVEAFKVTLNCDLGHSIFVLVDIYAVFTRNLIRYLKKRIYILIIIMNNNLFFNKENFENFMKKTLIIKKKLRSELMNFKIKKK
jgi:hypothetical protein